MKLQQIRIISELYYPEETSTGYFVTGIAEGLAASCGCAVSVLCAQPTYSQKGVLAAKHESRNRVEVQRLAAPSADNKRLLGRLWNTLSLTIRFGVSMFGFIKRDDHVVVVTNPPSLPLLVGWIAKLKGAVPVLLVHDVYPDVLVPTGITKEGSILYRFVDLLQRHMLRQMQTIVVLGRDMEKRLFEKLPESAHDRFSVIPNWGEADWIHPRTRVHNRIRASHSLDNKFVIQFSGNLGRTHGLDDLVALAEGLKPRKEIHFHDYLQQADLNELLSRCHVGVVPMQPDSMVAVPYKVGEYLAASLPVINSLSGELAELLQGGSCGQPYVVGNVDSLTKAMRHYTQMAYGDYDQESKAARGLFESHFDKSKTYPRFAQWILEQSGIKAS